MDAVNPKIPQSWKNVLRDEFCKKYFIDLKQFLLDEKLQYKIYPKNSNLFRAYNSMDFHDLKVVILGQDPYHGANQAHGLSFSVRDGILFPPSLKNIFTELVDDIGCAYPKNGNLSKWAKQGVLLLNTVLTVRAGEANSHRGMGWENFTDATIKAISDNLENVVFILWGRPAQMKEKLIDSSKHLVLKAPHPSPLSSYRGFFGSKPFSKTNAYLQAHAKEPIDWCLN
ncbi:MULTISPECIES: uracil-DNA glycosylase [Sulfurimonas]|uniref:uracil-DNA glycosylase n=1 Tax=Sulfurimonas TaxID=202746 RepID=UPI0012652B7A|nr:uracil-DNA glycosylase [Sulfurimonas indica]